MLLNKNWVVKIYMFVFFVMIGFLSLSVTIGSNQSSLYKDNIKFLNETWENKSSLSSKQVYKFYCR